jgi:alpha-glucosidase
VDYIEQTWLPGYNGSLTASVMPASTTAFLQGLLLLGSYFFRWGNAVPLRRADDCPGYKASNIVRRDSSVTADLTLAGAACNLYSSDLVDLKFLAEWQTGELILRHFLDLHSLYRLSPPCHDLRQGRTGISNT